MPGQRAPGLRSVERESGLPGRVSGARSRQGLGSQAEVGENPVDVVGLGYPYKFIANPSLSPATAVRGAVGGCNRRERRCLLATYPHWTASPRSGRPWRHRRE